MGQGIFTAGCCCKGSDGTILDHNIDGDVIPPKPVVLLSDITPSDLRDSSDADAFEKLQQAVSLSWNKKYSEASALLAEAEAILEESNCHVESPLRIALASDPALLEVRKHVAVLDNIVATASRASAMMRQNSATKMATAAGVPDLAAEVAEALGSGQPNSARWGRSSSKQSSSELGRSNSKLKSIQEPVREISKIAETNDNCDSLAQLQAELANVRKLSSQGLTFEAHDALHSLYVDIAAAIQLKAGSKVEDDIRGFSVQVDRDPMLKKMKDLHDQAIECFKLMQWFPPEEGLESKGGLTIFVPNAAVHPDYSNKIDFRFLEDKESYKDMPKPQILMCLQVKGIPQDICQSVATDGRHMDVDKPLAPNIERMEGFDGTEDQLWSTMATIYEKPILPLPFLPKEQNTLIQDFVTCIKSPPDTTLGPGVLKITKKVPSGMNECDGWKIPALAKGFKRGGSEKVFQYYTRSKNDPSTSEMSLIIITTSPVAKWMIPNRILKSMAPGVIKDQQNTYKRDIVDNWDKLGFQAKINEDAAGFYAAMKKF